MSRKGQKPGMEECASFDRGAWSESNETLAAGDEGFKTQRRGDAKDAEGKIDFSSLILCGLGVSAFNRSGVPSFVVRP